ncbi:MAG TPA: hypothetical protein VF912_03345 [Anaeromyxobacter sp.]
MRLSPLAVAALVALAPFGGRAEDAAPAPAMAPADMGEVGEMSREQAAAQAAAVDADAKGAAAAGLPLPDATAREGVQARAVLAGKTRPPHPTLGVAIGGGFPDLATASLLFRPIANVRFFAGPSWGYIGWGVQGGVVLAPWDGWIVPTLSLEGGRLFRSDLSFLAKDKGGVPEGIEPLLAKIDYQYAALDLGLELGSSRGFAFSIRLGLSYVSIKANGTATYTSDDGSKVTFTDPAFHGTLPSVKVGFQYWL